MTIEDAPHCVRDGFIQIVAIDEHGDQTGDRTRWGRAELFHGARQQIEDRRRVAPRAGRFAPQQSDLALRHRHAGHAVQQEHHVVPLVPKTRSDRHRREDSSDAHQRRLFGSREDDHRATAPCRAEAIFQKGADLATTFAHERDDVHIRPRGLRDFSQQRALADSAPRKEADPLTSATSQQSVNDSDTGFERTIDPGPMNRAGSDDGALAPAAGTQLWPAVDGPTQPIQHPPQQRRPDRHTQRSATRSDRQTGTQSSGLHKRE